MKSTRHSYVSRFTPHVSRVLRATFQHPARSLSDIAVRDEAKEVRPDARPQARKNRRRIHWNTLRIFRGREQCRCVVIIRRSSMVNVGQALRYGNSELSRTGLSSEVNLFRSSSESKLIHLCCRKE